MGHWPGRVDTDGEAIRYDATVQMDLSSIYVD